MSAQNKAAGQDDTAAKTAHPDDTQKTHVAILCPCCSAEVTHRRYGFDVIACAPHLTLTTWFVCDTCEVALTGTDDAARDATVRAFEAHLEGSEHDPRH